MAKIWTMNVLRALFEQLTMRYGPHATWEKATLPGRGLDEDYREFLNDFARAVGAKSGGAVDLKINHAIYRNSPAEQWQFHTAARCIAAAEETGFILAEDEEGNT